MKKFSIIGFLIVGAASSAIAQDKSSALQVVTFGIKKSASQHVAKVMTAISSVAPMNAIGSSEMQVPVPGKKITYRSNIVSSGVSGVPLSIPESYKQLRPSQIQSRSLTVTITD